MKEFLVGFISGIVTSLGMGGGTILILLLGLFTNLEQHLIQGINLIFFVPTSIVAIFMNIKRKTIDYKTAIYLITSGIIGAIIGSKISFKIDNGKLREYFGIFLIIIAFFEILTFIMKYNIEKNEK